jgi:plasmid stability protein
LRRESRYHGAITCQEETAMSDLLIRNLDPDIHKELKRRADEEQVSLQAYVSRVLGQHTARPTMKDWLRRLEELPRHPEISGADAIREAREELM